MDPLIVLEIVLSEEGKDRQECDDLMDVKGDRNVLVAYVHKKRCVDLVGVSVLLL